MKQVIIKNPAEFRDWMSCCKDIYKKELLQILDYYISEAKMVVFHNFPFDGMVLRKEGITV